MDKDRARALVKEYKIYKSDGCINSNALKKMFRDYDLSGLDGDSPEEKVYLLFNKRPICPVCGKNIPYRPHGRGYSKTCSPECRNKLKSQYIKDHKDEIYTVDSIQKRKNTCLEKYGCENPSQNKEIKAKRATTNLEKYGCENVFGNKDIQDKIKQTNIKNLGVENPAKSSIIRNIISDKNKEIFNNDDGNNPLIQQIQNTNLDRYGVKTPLQNPDIRAKVDKTKELRYGNSKYNNLEKGRQTRLSKYGNEEIFKTDYFKDKNRDVCLKKYGHPYYVQTKEFKNHCISTSLSKYGTEYPSQNDNVKKAIKESNRNTCLKRYGVNSYFETKDFDQKFRESCLLKFGVDHPSKNPDIKRKMFSCRSKSSPEKKLEEFLRNRGLEYQYEYECNGKNFDFAIFSNGTLRILVEVDGEYFHGLNSDYDDKHVHGEFDCARFSKVPDGVKFIACDSLRVEDCFDEILRVFNISYDKWIQEIIDSLPVDFPYPEYSDDRLRTDYKHLCNYKVIKKRSRIADSTIRQFHKSIWHSHLSEKPSPYEAWYDKDLLEKCVKNRFIYSSNLSSQAIVNGFNVCKIAPKVSVFSASLAKYLIQKYLSDYNTVFDPFSGFSGRLLGTCACGKMYMGQDISEEHVKESNEIIQYHNLNAIVRVQDILTDTGGEYDCLFTCSPYDNKEIWGNESIFKSCDEWIDVCLSKYRCNKYLFVVNETEKYKDFIVEELSNTSHIGDSKEYIICIDTKE